MAVPSVAQELGMPPPDASATVTGPTVKEAPQVEEPSPDSTTATLSAGALSSSGNSKMIAGTVNGAYDLRSGANGVGASLLGNYGRTAVQGGDMQTNVKNLQGRARYDRFLIDELSAFLITTGRYDRFQGLSFRLNVDPGVKYLFINHADAALWGEFGYDYQHDIRNDYSRVIRDADGAPVLDDAGQRQLIDKTKDDHSARAFFGFRYAFTPEVTLSTGLEYLQSFIETKQYRLNYDAVFASQIGGGLSVGMGFSARYDNNPLPDKAELDTATTINLIYSYSDAEPPPTAPPECPNCEPCAPNEPPAMPESDSVETRQGSAATTGASPAVRQPATSAASEPRTSEPSSAPAAVPAEPAAPSSVPARAPTPPPTPPSGAPILEPSEAAPLGG